MTRINLTRLLRRSKPGYRIVSGLLQAFNAPLAVLDVNGALLLGASGVAKDKKTAVLQGDECAGWVAGPEPHATALVLLLEGMLAQEVEKRSLADELLDGYRELNLLYNLSERLLAAPEPERIAATALQEIGQLIQISAAWVLFFDDDAQELGPLAATGLPLTFSSQIGKNDFVAGVLARSEAEICNDVNGSDMFQECQAQRISLLCAPLKTEQRMLGAILLMRAKPVSFTARDLKLLNTVALQAGPAIEMGRLYQIAVVQGRMERELQMAYEVQASLIPAELPSFSTTGWGFAGRWRPARELSGDYYDFIPHSEDTYGLVIADVADKGMPSALFMVNTRSAVRTAVYQSQTPAAAISGANRLVAQEATDGLFVSLIYGQLNCESGSLTYVNAGHNPALHYHAHNGTLTELNRTGIPLGILIDVDYTQNEIRLQPGDAAIFYTDGVTEAVNLDNEEFGMERLRTTILDHQNATADALAAAIETSVAQFTGPVPPFDDLTLMIVRRQLQH